MTVWAIRSRRRGCCGCIRARVRLGAVSRLLARVGVAAVVVRLLIRNGRRLRLAGVLGAGCAGTARLTG